VAEQAPGGPGTLHERAKERVSSVSFVPIVSIGGGRLDVMATDYQRVREPHRNTEKMTQRQEKEGEGQFENSYLRKSLKIKDH
jgi:hypothetical protein